MTLEESIENLYRTFRHYPLRHVEGCPCCTDESDSRKLHKASLRHLAETDLERFAFSAMTTFGNVDDFRHFLPRLFHLLSIHGSIGFTDPQVLIGKLSYGQWTRWPEKERDALRAFLAAWWDDALSRFPGAIEAEDALCSIAQAEDDLTPYLLAWEGAKSASAMHHLANFVESDVGPMVGRKFHSPRKLGDAFWVDRRPQMERVIVWLLRPPIQKLLENAFFTADSPEATSSLSAAAEYLRFAMQREE